MGHVRLGGLGGGRRGGGEDAEGGRGGGGEGGGGGLLGEVGTELEGGVRYCRTIAAVAI